MWFLRKMLKVSWAVRMSDEKVMDFAGIGRGYGYNKNQAVVISGA